MKPYLDTSLFVRYFLNHSNILGEIEAEFESIPINSLTQFEFVQSLQLLIWLNRNDRTKGYPAAKVEVALNLFHAAMGNEFRLSLPDWEKSIAQALTLARQTKDKGYRTVDILHVAIAATQRTTHFYSFDRMQNELAASQGMKVPLLHR